MHHFNSHENLGVRMHVGYLVHGCSRSVGGDGSMGAYIGGQWGGVGRRRARTGFHSQPTYPPPRRNPPPQHLVCPVLSLSSC